MEAATILLAVFFAIAFPDEAFAANVLPQSGPAFKGKIGHGTKASTPDWPKPLLPPKGSPNVLLILLDDVGFADSATFGGAVRTPALDKLAEQGLRYNNFHTTSMCSPTRAALLSGRNHHRVGFGRISNIAGGYPGYDTIWKRDAASVARVLHDHGYSTAAFGKWHNTPEWEISPVGPFDRWPTGLGFDYFYGSMQGADNQWAPNMLYRNTTPVEPPNTASAAYHFTKDIADEAIRWIRTHEGLAPSQPWFVYFATGATHAPHHVPKEWIDQYRGRFDQGWDVLREEIFARQKRQGIIPVTSRLNPRPEGLPAWTQLSADEKRLLSRQMEVYAAFLAHTDYEIGRLIETVNHGISGKNTLILYIVGDNGPEGVGGVTGTDFSGDAKARLGRIAELGSNASLYNNYSYGWAWAGATPFNGTKGLASHLGGLRNPLIVSWPAMISDSGGIRPQFTHVNDVAPTIYEVTKIEPPKAVDGIAQAPMDGVSFAYSFYDARARARHSVQYFETWSNRALYKDGWFASARNTPFINRDQPGGDPADDEWGLYDLAGDFSQSQNVAAFHPQRLADMRQIFENEARKNRVYPLGAGPDERRYDALPFLINRARTLTFYPDMDRVPPLSINIDQRSFRITSYVSLTGTNHYAETIELWRLCACALTDAYDQSASIENGVAVLNYSDLDGIHHKIVSPPLKTGPNVFTFIFTRASEAKAVDRINGITQGVGLLYVNDHLIGEEKMQVGVHTGIAFFRSENGTPGGKALVERVVLTLED